MPKPRTGGKPGRPESLSRQLKVAQVMELRAQDPMPTKSQIAAAVGITQAQVDEFYAEGKRVYVTQPTEAAINLHRARLETILEVLEAKAMEGKLFSIDRYLQTLDRLGQLNGVNYADRAKHMLPNHGAEIDKWLSGSVEAGGFGDEPELVGRIIEDYADDADMAPRELTPETIEEEMELAAQFSTPNELEKPRPATERRKSRR